MKRTTKLQRPHLIGLTGRARSGKDTIADYLVKEPYDYERYALANGVKHAALAINPIVLTSHYEMLSSAVSRLGWEEAKAYDHVRTTLQRIGTEAGWQMHGRDLWLRYAENAIYIDNIHTSQRHIVITDIRFDHEAQWIKDHGGVIWRVVRPDHAQSLSGNTRQHVSEQGEFPADITIANDGTIDDLYRHIDTLLTA